MAEPVGRVSDLARFLASTAIASLASDMSKRADFASIIIVALTSANTPGAKTAATFAKRNLMRK